MLLDENKICPLGSRSGKVRDVLSLAPYELGPVFALWHDDRPNVYVLEVTQAGVWLITLEQFVPPAGAGWAKPACSGTAQSCPHRASYRLGCLHGIVRRIRVRLTARIARRNPKNRQARQGFARRFQFRQEILG